MNIIGKRFVPLFLAAILLDSCMSSPATPTLSSEEIIGTHTHMSSVSTEFAETRRAMPTGTATAALLPTISFITRLPTQTALAPIRTLTTEAYIVLDRGGNNVWDGPGTQFKVTGQIRSQTRYPVIGKYLDWWLIDLGNHQSGWINVLVHGTRFVGNAEAVPEVAPPPSPTPYVYPSSTPLVFTDPSIPLSERIVYYYHVQDTRNPTQEGVIVARPAGLLGPTYADAAYTSDTVADLRTALEIVLHDERNRWPAPEFKAEIVDITFRSGHAKVLLQGTYGIGGPNPYASVVGGRMLILLTMFANPSVQTAAVSLNEDTIANLDISDRTQAKPADYVYTRAAIETYMQENAYVPPPPPNTPTPYVHYHTPTPPASIDPSRPLPELAPDAIDLRWITAYGLPGDQTVTTIQPTKDGGFILVGNDALLRLRADGLILWQKSLGGVEALDVLETVSGDFILAGDHHWIRLDSQGNVLWQYTFGEPSYHSGPILRLVEEKNGNIVIEALGSRTVFRADGELESITEYTMNLDSQEYSGGIKARLGETLWAGEGGSYRYWVGKADRTNGWLDVFSSPEKPIGGPPLIHPLVDGGALVTAFIYGEGGYDMLVSRISRDGSVRWGQFYGSGSDFHAFETRSGDTIMAWTMYHNSTFTFRDDILIFCLDRDGRVRWMKVYGTEGWDPAGQDAVDVIQELSNGDLIFAGHTNGAGTGGKDIWVLKMNAQGEIPNCSLALEDRDVWTGGASPKVDRTALKRTSRTEREAIPIVEEEKSPFGNVEVQTIPLCSPAS